MAGRGGLRALRERFGMHEWDQPPNFVVLGRPVGEGSTEAQRWLTALGIGMGEPCPPMEEQRGWSPGQEDPSYLQWDSSRSRRTGPTGHQPLLIRGQRAVSGREDPRSLR